MAVTPEVVNHLVGVGTSGCWEVCREVTDDHSLDAVVREPFDEVSNADIDCVVTASGPRPVESPDPRTRVLVFLQFSPEPGDLFSCLSEALEQVPATALIPSPGCRRTCDECIDSKVKRGDFTTSRIRSRIRCDRDRLIYSKGIVDVVVFDRERAWFSLPMGFSL